MSKKYPKPVRFTPKNPEKYVGDINNIIARSSWELDFLKWCDMHQDVISYASEEIAIPYTCPTDFTRKIRRYYPDFLIKMKDSEGNTKSILIEIKPFNQTVVPNKGNKRKKTYMKECATYAMNDSKWTAARKFCKEKGIEFKILTERELYGNS